MIRYFAIVAFVVGTAFVFVDPPLRAPDEGYHFARAYQLSHLKVVSDKQDNIGGGYIPLSIITMDRHFDSMFYDGATFRELKAYQKVPLDPENVRFLRFPSIAVYPPVPFIPQALGIKMTLAFSTSVLDAMYGGRFANLVAYVLLICIALKSVANPNVQVAISVIALLPMALYQAGSLSADSLTIAIAILFVSLIWKIASAETNATRADIATLAVASLALSLTKIAYAPMLLALLAIPIKRIGSARRFGALLAAITAINLIAIGIWISQIGLHPVVNPSPDVDSIKQIAYLRSDPMAVARICLATFQVWWAFIAKGVVGVFGRYEYPIPAGLMLAYAALLGIALFGTPRALVKRGVATALGTTVIGVIVIVMLSYIEWTPVKAANVEGLQGRYFIPLLPLWILALPKASFLKINRLVFTASALITAYSVVFLAQQIFTCFPGSRFYWRFSGQ